MRFSRRLLNRLGYQPDVKDTVVVIDVLRSFTTTSVALSKGASAIYPVEDLAAASELLERMERPVSVGATAGGDPVPGFDYGNSPSELMRAELGGRPVVISSAAGVRALHRFRHAQKLFAASLVCEWIDRDGDEDIACADYIEMLLRGDPTVPEVFARRVRDSDFGKRFAAGIWPNLPRADLELAARVDLFDFSMPVRCAGEHMLIRPFLPPA